MCSFIVTQATLLCNGSKVTLNGNKSAFKKPIPFFFYVQSNILQTVISVIAAFRKIALDQRLSSLFGDLHLCNSRGQSSKRDHNYVHSTTCLYKS